MGCDHHIKIYELVALRNTAVGSYTALYERIKQQGPPAHLLLEGDRAARHTPQQLRTMMTHPAATTIIRRAAPPAAISSPLPNAVCGPGDVAWPRVPYTTPENLRLHAPSPQLGLRPPAGRVQQPLDTVAAAAAAAAGPSATVPAPSAAQLGIVLEAFPVLFDGYEYEGWIAYEADAPPRPQVLVVPNYAGLKQFDRDQAVFLASAGFVGIAVDIYKEVDGYRKADRSPRELPGWRASSREEKQAIAAKHMEEAFKFVNHFMADPAALRASLAAYLAHGRAHPAVDSDKAAAIGYCFGGGAVLEMVRGGLPVDAVVSFHGVLQMLPASRETPLKKAANHYNASTKVLVESGDLDDLVPQRSVDKFKAEFDAAGIDWRFSNHSRTPHGFALAPGCFNSHYTEAADRRSTLSMLSLFAECWPGIPQRHVHANACGTVLGQAIASPATMAVAAASSSSKL